MKCAEVKNLLSLYIENDLDAQIKGLLDEHIRSCANCAGELKELKDLVSSLKNIPEVEPPPYFLQAVHARLKQPSRLNEFLKRLFVPVYIKLPLEAIAITAAAILVFFLFQRTEYGALFQQQEFKELAKVETAGVRPERLIKQEPVSQPAYTKAALSYSAMKAGAMADSQQIGYFFDSFSSKEAAKSVTEGIKAQTGTRSFLSAPANSLYTAAVPKVSGLAEKPILQESTEKQIIVKTEELSKDVAGLQSLLDESGIKEIKYESYPNHEVFIFSVSGSEFKEFLNKLRAWHEIIFPLQDQTITEEEQTKPIPVKIILTSQ